MIESLLIKRFTTTVGNNCVRLKEKTHSFFGARKTINNTTIHGWVSAEKSTFLSPWFIIGHTDVHLNTFSNTRQIYHKMILLMTFRVVELLGNWPVNKYCVDSVIFFFAFATILPVANIFVNCVKKMPWYYYDSLRFQRNEFSMKSFWKQSNFVARTL